MVRDNDLSCCGYFTVFGAFIGAISPFFGAAKTGAYVGLGTVGADAGIGAAAGAGVGCVYYAYTSCNTDKPESISSNQEHGVLTNQQTGSVTRYGALNTMN